MTDWIDELGRMITDDERSRSADIQRALDDEVKITELAPRFVNEVAETAKAQAAKLDQILAGAIGRVRYTAGANSSWTVQNEGRLAASVACAYGEHRRLLTVTTTYAGFPSASDAWQEPYALVMVNGDLSVSGKDGTFSVPADFVTAILKSAFSWDFVKAVTSRAAHP
jgi:hypothetical protein